MLTDYVSEVNDQGTVFPVKDVNAVDWESYAKTGVHNLWKIASSVVSKTDHGVAFTVNRNSSGQVTSVEASRTSADSTDSYLIFTESYDVSAPMILSGCPSGGGVDKYRLIAYNNNTQAYYNDDGDGVEIPAGNYILMLRYYKAFSSNITVYPMLCLTTDTNPAFTPYAMTNRELTDAVTDLQTVKKGKTYQLSGAILTGLITSGSSEIHAFIPRPNVGGNITAAISCPSFIVRGNKGYVKDENGTDMNGSFAFDNNLKITLVSGDSDFGFFVIIKNKNDGTFSNVDNNTPLVIECIGAANTPATLTIS